MTAEGLLQLDGRLLYWINSHHNPFLDIILAPAAYLGECGAVWILICLIMFVFGGRTHRRTALLLIIAMVITDRIFAQIMGHAFYRTRPYLALDGVRQVGIRWTNGSFPSGHAHSVWLAAVVIGSRWHKFALPLVIFALITCYSRPYFGMHYPLDVVAGSMLGIASGYAALFFDSLLVRRSERRTMVK